MSCIADSWAGVNNWWSAESVGMAGALRRSSTEDPVLENLSSSSSEASCSMVNAFGKASSVLMQRFLPVCRIITGA